MREVHVDEITKAVKELFLKANYELPEDVEKAFKEALKKEESEAGKEVLNLILLNAEVAKRKGLLTAKTREWRLFSSNSAKM